SGSPAPNGLKTLMRSGNHLALRKLVTVLTFAGIATGANAAPAAGQITNAPPPHPRLLLNAEGVAQLKQRIATAPWTKASWDELKAATEKSLAGPAALPPRGG